MAFVRKFLFVSERLLHGNNCVFSSIFNAERFFNSKIDLPSPPKRPLTAYMLFCKENRKEVLKENPHLSSPEQVKHLAQLWHKLSPDRKKPYEVAARNDIIMYGQAHKEYYEQLTDEQRQELAKLKDEKKLARRLSKLKRTIKESGLPKRPSNAFSLFVQSRAKSKDLKNIPAFFKEVATEWQNLPEEDKKKFTEQAVEARKTYEQQMKEWQEKLNNEGKTDLLNAYKVYKQKGNKGLLAEMSSSLFGPRKVSSNKAKIDSSSKEKSQ